MLTGMAVPCFAGEKDDGSSITVLVESGSPAEALANDTAADFEKETGCKVVVDAVAYTGMYDKLSTEIKAGQAAHDVSCMDFVWLAALLMQSNQLQMQIPVISFQRWKKAEQ